MNLYINNYLSGIEVINSALQSQKSGLTHERVEKIMSNLDQLLHDLKHHIKKEKFTPLTEPLKPWIVEVLQDVHQTLNLYADGRLEKIESIKHKILDLQFLVDVHPVFTEKNIPCGEVVSIAYFCDLHTPDHNGAISLGLKQAMVQSIPFITTRSMLLSSGRVANEDTAIIDHFLGIQKVIFKYRDRWDIYQNGEVFVFIPRSISPESTDFQRLEALDLRTDGYLKKSSIESIYEKAAVKSSIQDVIDLFVSHAKVDTIFYAVGHGGSESVAALGKEDYGTFLDFLHHRRCKGLAISSCSSGGKSSLLNIPEKGASGHARFLDQDKPHPFPVLVRSVGDFVTYSEQPAEDDLREFLDEFAYYSKGSQTLAQLRRTIQNIEGGQRKSFANHIKFYPAHSAGIPGGFRPINEGENAFSLTYNEVKKAEIEPVISKKSGKALEPGVIVVEDVGTLEVHPLVIPLTIVFEKHNPILFSMTPGHGHHFLKAVRLTNSFSVRSPFDFIIRTMSYHKNDLRYANKGFFFGEIELDGKKLTGVALKMTPSGSIGVGRGEDGDYYFSKDGAVPTKITRFLHGVICREIIQTTRPDEKATISMSGGQESEVQFEEAVHEAKHFFTDFDKIFELNDDLFFEHVENQMQPEDREAAVIYLLEKNDTQRAFKLFKSGRMDPNIKKFNGTPVLFAAVQANAVEMIRYLLEHGADINIPSHAGRPVLNQALVQLGVAYKKRERGMDNAKAVDEGEEILDLLLNTPSLNLEALNSLGWTAVPNALVHTKLVEKLISRGAKIDYCHPKGRSLLATLILTGERDELDMLLAFNPDPNLGTPTALSNAFKINDAVLIGKLLELGGTPFKVDSDGKVPFMEAVFWTSAEVLKILLEREDCNPEVISKNGLFPILAAHIIGSKEKIRMLRNKKFAFPAGISKCAEYYLKGVVDRYVQLDDEEAIKDLLKTDNAPQNVVAEHLLEKNNGMLLKKLIEDGVIDISALSGEALAKLTAYETLSLMDGDREDHLVDRPCSRILVRSM